jgi:hypothetical protein
MLPLLHMPPLLLPLQHCLLAGESCCCWFLAAAAAAGGALLLLGNAKMRPLLVY